MLTVKRCKTTSTYSEKKHQPICAWRDCHDFGVSLRVYAGQLDWFCNRHIELIDKVKK